MGFFSNISNAVRRMGGNGRSIEQSDPVPSLVSPTSHFNPFKIWCDGGKVRPCRDYKNVIFFQFVKMIGVLFNDVELTYKGGAPYKDAFDSFVSWFNRYAFMTWHFVCMNGYAVIVREKDANGKLRGFKTLTENTEFEWVDNIVEVDSRKYDKPFVMTSDVRDCFGMSDFAFLDSYLTLAEKYLNNSDLAIDGNGHILLVSPDIENQHTNTVLDEKQIEEWEKFFKESKSKFADSFLNVLFSNRVLRTTDIDLTNFDTANFDKLIKVMLVICGHFDLPANQVPILETSASKGLTTGNELRIGDSLKYKTFERILQWFVVDCAQFFNISLEYTINNDPNNQPVNTTTNEN